MADERGIVDADQAPLGDGERLPARACGIEQSFQTGPRRGVGQPLVVDVSALDVDVGGAGVVVLGCVPGHSRVVTRERAPEDTEPRERVRRQVAAPQGGETELRQLRVDRRRRAAVKDEIDAGERLAEAGRRVRGVLRAPVRLKPRVEGGRIVHLGHRPDIDPLAPGRDRLTERDQVPVALAGGDSLRRDRLAPVATPGAEMEHRDRRQRRQEAREG